MTRQRQRSVGYGNPPAHSQFRKGTSGNPKGRPKGSSSIVTLVDKVFNGLVKVDVQGQQRSMRKIEAILFRVASKAMAGDPQAIKLAVELMKFLEKATIEIADKRPLIIQLTEAESKL
jgi:Family of unknown function (DUF5681)